MAVAILSTKLFVPSARVELISRPHLFRRLDEGLSCKLILVSAPAGFGKTTLVAQWLQWDTSAGEVSDGVTQPANLSPGPAQFAWLSLDESDNDPTRFWAYTITALDNLQAGIGQQALDLLLSSQPSLIDTVLTLLINDLMAISADFVLVLDDYHLIENQAIHTGLTFLLEHLPPLMHLVISSRVDPPLPLARLRARRQLAELRAGDLRLTPAETSLFLNRTMNLNLLADDVAALEQRTEGWIAGLQLAALSMQNRPDIHHFITTFTGSHIYVLDYLIQEVLQPQPASVQSFLLQTAILDQLTAPLCDAVTGREDSQAILEQLARGNLFITPLDDHCQWYRYHPLFADLLRHRRQQTPALKMELPELHRRAAAWYEQAGLIEQALDHTLACQDFDSAQALIEKNLILLLKRSSLSGMLAKLEAMPAEYLRTRPILGLAYAWVLLFAGKLNAARQQLQEVRAELEKYDRDSLLRLLGDEAPAWLQGLQGAIPALEAQIALIQGEIPRVIELSRQALACFPTDEIGLVLRALTVQNLATAYWLRGGLEVDDQILSEVYITSQAVQNPSTALIAASNLAELRKLQGQFKEAAQLYRRILQLASEEKEYHFPIMVGTAHVELGHLLYEWNDLEKAADHLQQGVRLSQQGTGLRVAGMGYIALAQVCLAQGRLQEAVEIARQAEQLARELDLSFPWALVKILYVRLWIVQGHLAPVAEWVNEHNLTVTDSLDRRSVFEYVHLARALIALGQLETAERLLAQLFHLVEEAQWASGMIMVLVLQAITFEAQQRTIQALAALEKAVVMAEPEEYIRTFVDEGEPVARLLYAVAARGTAPGYTGRLLAAFSTPETKLANPPDFAGSPLKTTAAGADQIVEPLTERELEILRLIAGGLSNREIARELYLSLGTVKLHAHNIYGKLGVSSRTQAVARGRMLGLIGQA